MAKTSQQKKVNDNVDKAVAESTKRVEVRECPNKRCYSPFQDKQYAGKRVFNAMGMSISGWRCTVCSKEVGR